MIAILHQLLFPVIWPGYKITVFNFQNEFKLKRNLAYEHMNICHLPALYLLIVS